MKVAISVPDRVHRAADRAARRMRVPRADAGYSRAAFPFTFTDNFVGQARNGLATFVFDRLGVSPMAVQITQETAPQGEHVRADFSALVPLRWDPECPAGAEAAAAAFTRERAARLPLHPWSDLPNAQASWTTVRNGFADTDLSAVALLMDGELYQQEGGRASRSTTR
jgi:hypothetical protein